ncbi:MAG: 4-hydroxybenzoate octaprenyltransferase [Hydrotalea flava]|uniref:UbiA-like polyprenyltransferase n=1 Tax=Hydrotalea TaxID=1004300 RepID=UPI00094429A4|nr:MULTISPECIES: UbiA-like polyprenyltransferase [Hydrotalea]MBY0348490.1 putative 4-hydroxybenzoate polyprenyltransferase [Hydrotalea flava]NIM34766.1 4-hydroxybenzoate octaprenyltransferase [Hydrotalea flava]NIM37602.1 4-hydroxybenzoate octaprenyltransferase [Hydrotalea flava]NIN02762.1 4-hydroxybenzoate octaprenyltransferase [Hydrotalea flava]NIN14447.1 4-hydroxybenzoate octaprenyltransferase [Hydrotalea flava]
MHKVKKYLSLVKFSHTIFAMPFAFIGFFLGVIHRKTSNMFQEVGNNKTIIQHSYFSNQYVLEKFLLVIICMVTARNAAMAFNRYLDRHFDARNPRTAIREIPKGIISPESALRFVLLNCLLFMGTTYFINKICFYLAPVALFVVLFYSYTKRFTALCHLVLGLGLSLAPIGAYLAVTGTFNLLPVLFSFAVIFWVSGFDVIYALQDIEFDQSQDLYSIPAVFGKAAALRISSFLHFLSAACVILAGYYGHFHWLYWIGILLFTGMLLYQHSIVKPNDLSRVNIAFMTANGIASVVFSVFVIADLFIF